MHASAHSSKSPVKTKGLLIHWASFYDSVTNIMAFGQTQLLRNMTVGLSLLKPGESLLDVGCGTGGVTIPGKRRVGRNGTATGIDPSREMLTVAKEKAGRAGLEIDFRLGVIESLPIPDTTFDVVTSSLMMHHLTPDLRLKGLTEIYRVLKPGGRLLVADTMMPGGFLAKRLFTLLSRRHGIKFGIEDLPETMKNVGFFPAAQLDDHFHMIGFVRAIKPRNSRE